MKQSLRGRHLVIVACVGIIGIVAMALFAISKGIDGIVFSAAIGTITAIIGALGGVHIAKRGKDG